MFNKNLQPIYEGRVLVNGSAMNEPAIVAALKEMSLRNFEPLPTQMREFGTSQTEINKCYRFGHNL